MKVFSVFTKQGKVDIQIKDKDVAAAEAVAKDPILNVVEKVRELSDLANKLTKAEADALGNKVEKISFKDVDGKVVTIEKGGPGSGCQGPNCGRPAGGGSATEDDDGSTVGPGDSFYSENSKRKATIIGQNFARLNVPYKHQTAVREYIGTEKFQDDVVVHHIARNKEIATQGHAMGPHPAVRAINAKLSSLGYTRKSIEALRDAAGKLTKGGPGSGCQGPNCGRPAGSGGSSETGGVAGTGDEEGISDIKEETLGGQKYRTGVHAESGRKLLQDPETKDWVWRDNTDVDALEDYEKLTPEQKKTYLTHRQGLQKPALSHNESMARVKATQESLDQHDSLHSMAQAGKYVDARDAGKTHEEALAAAGADPKDLVRPASTGKIPRVGGGKPVSVSTPSKEDDAAEGRAPKAPAKTGATAPGKFSISQADHGKYLGKLPAGNYDVVEETPDSAHSGPWGSFSETRVRHESGKEFSIPTGNAQLIGLLPQGRGRRKSIDDVRDIAGRMAKGGAGSGCQGPNCGRPKGSGSGGTGGTGGKHDAKEYEQYLNLDNENAQAEYRYSREHGEDHEGAMRNALDSKLPEKLKAALKSTKPKKIESEWVYSVADMPGHDADEKFSSVDDGSFDATAAVKKQIKASLGKDAKHVQFTAPEFVETDSGNVTHAGAYYNVKFKGPENLLARLHQDGVIFNQDWEDND